MLLYLLRMIQGFSTGGEYGGAATFMAEYAPDRRRGFFGSFLEFGTLAGFSLGALLMLGLITILGDDAMNAWGWRLPFLVAAPLGLVGMYLRSRMEDTPVFRELERSRREGGGRRDAVQGPGRPGYWRPHPQARRPGHRAERGQLHAAELHRRPTCRPTIGLDEQRCADRADHRQLAMMVVLPFAGALSDRVGRKPLWWFR